MRIEQLRYVLHVAESGSVSRSARELNISQQGMSQSIHQLERELDTRLLYRDGNCTRLTAAGKLLRENMESMVHSCDEMYAALAADAAHSNRDEAQTCRMRVTPNFCIAAMPAVIQRMGRAHPKLLLSISETEILDILRLPDLDSDEIFVVTCPERFVPLLEEKEGSLAFRELYRTEIHAVVDPAHPLARRQIVTIDDLCVYPVALLGSDIYLLRNIAGSRFKEVNIRLHTTNFDLYRAATAMRDTISFTVPLAYGRVDAAKMVQVPLEHSETIVFGYVENRYTRSFPMARELLSMIEGELAKIEEGI